ncbi:unnamed protein product [Brugia timori]|uniref:Uncharacterized protein n=1 Tax=Brugia timori TaxID=42155 RepID=A0A3P7WL39_9BILA|nr:unnamed protein product [Brugia timori]
MNKIRRLDDEVRRKIEKNERRLAMTQPVIKDASKEGGEGETDAQRRQKELISEQQSNLSAKINDCMEKASYTCEQIPCFGAKTPNRVYLRFPIISFLLC